VERTILQGVNANTKRRVRPPMIKIKKKE